MQSEKIDSPPRMGQGGGCRRRASTSPALPRREGNLAGYVTNGRGRPGVTGCKIVLDLRGPFSRANSARPLGIAADSLAFASWSLGVIGCSRLQGLANLGGQLST